MQSQPVNFARASMVPQPHHPALWWPSQDVQWPHLPLPHKKIQHPCMQLIIKIVALSLEILCY